MMHWLDGIQASIGNGRWVLIGDQNTHHVKWSLDGRGDSVRKVRDDRRNTRGAKLMRGREHTCERRCRNLVVVLRIDYAIAGGAMQQR